MKLTDTVSGMKFAGLLAILILVISSLGCTSSSTNKDDSKTLSEADYKATCKEIPISELKTNINKYVGQNIKYTGKVIQQNFGYDSEGKVNSTGLIFQEGDSFTLYAVYDNSTDLLVYRNVTVFGEVYGNDTVRYVNSWGAYRNTTLPRINAPYIEISKPAPTQTLEETSTSS